MNLHVHSAHRQRKSLGCEHKKTRLLANNARRYSSQCVRALRVFILSRSSINDWPFDNHKWLRLTLEDVENMSTMTTSELNFYLLEKSCGRVTESQPSLTNYHPSSPDQHAPPSVTFPRVLIQDTAPHQHSHYKETPSCKPLSGLVIAIPRLLTWDAPLTSCPLLHKRHSHHLQLSLRLILVPLLNKLSVTSTHLSASFCCVTGRQYWTFN